MFSLKIIVVFSLAFFVFGQVNLETEYCLTDFPAFATKQVKMELSARNTDPAQRLKGFQNFIDGTKNIGLSLYEQNGNVKLDTITQNLQTTTFSHISTNPIHYIDSKNEYILGREIINAAQGLVAYIMLRYQTGSANLLKITLDPFDATQLNNPELWDITDILSIESDGKVYVVGYGEQQTALFEVNPSLTTKNFKHFEYLDANNRLQITSGNLNYIFDNKCELVFKKNSVGQPFEAQTLSNAQISNTLKSGNIYTTQLTDGVFILDTFSGTEGKIIRVDAINGINTNGLSIFGKPKFGTDDYTNSWVSTQTNFIWIRVVNKAPVHFQLSTSTLTQSQKDQLLAIINSNLIHIGFEDDIVILIYAIAQSFTKASIATLKFNSGSPNTVTIIDNKKHVYDQKDLFPNLRIIPKSPTEIKTEYKCNCVEDEIVKIECFDKEFKCISTTVPKRRNCSKTLNIQQIDLIILQISILTLFLKLQTSFHFL